MTDDARKLIATLLADAEPDNRRRSAEMLATTGGLATVAALAAALEDENKGVRDAASRSLCSIGGSMVAFAIVEHIGNKNIVTRNLASELLVKLGNIAVPPLLPYLRDQDRDVRKFAVDILGLIGNPAASEEIVLSLEDPDENVVVSSVEALGNIRAHGSVQPLFNAYDRFEYTRPAVVEALGKIGDPASGDFLLLRFEEALASSAPDPVLLFALIEALGIVGSGRTATVLQQHAGEVKGRLRSALLHTLLQIADRTGIRHQFPESMRSGFLEAFQDPDPQIQFSAATVLVSLEGSDITADLVQALGRSPELDAYLMQYLPARSDAFGAAVRYLETHRSTPARVVIGLLGKLALDMVKTVMRGPVTDDVEKQVQRGFILIADQWNTADEETRGIIVDVLFRIDGDGAIEFIDALMNDPDPWLRIHVIEIISAIADPRALAFVARFLNDDDDNVREVALETLQARGVINDAASLEV